MNYPYPTPNEEINHDTLLQWDRMHCHYEMDFPPAFDPKRIKWLRANKCDCPLTEEQLTMYKLTWA